MKTIILFCSFLIINALGYELTDEATNIIVYIVLFCFITDSVNFIFKGWSK